MHETEYCWIGFRSPSYVEMSQIIIAGRGIGRQLLGAPPPLVVGGWHQPPIKKEKEINKYICHHKKYVLNS